MIELLEFIFQSGWHFFGVLLLMVMFLRGVAVIVLAFKGMRDE